MVLALSCALTVDAQKAPPISARFRSVQPGELLVLTVDVPEGADEVTVKVFDRSVPAFAVDARTWRALVGIDLDVKAASYTADVEARSAGISRHVANYSIAVKAKQFRRRTLTVDPDFVTPPQEFEARIVREAEELDRLLKAVSPERLWTGPFVTPVKAAANSAFGSRSVYNGVPRNPHAGADFPASTGTPIAAPNTGRVVLAKDLYFSGNTVILDHGLGMLSLLAHLSKIDVREGDVVKAGGIVGRAGATGRVTGPHLHWAVRLGNARVDPVSVLALLGK
jgi:murein DD-endopeptidase MepM/ murein hydrolase activator NlpD